jgi:AcrR family transcriptional regulator
MTVSPRVGRPALTDEELGARKRRILAQTLLLVAESGPGNVRLRDVAAAAEVSVGTLQHYFQSRDQLIREAFTQHAYGVIEDVLLLRESASSWDGLQRMFDNVFSAHEIRTRSLLWLEFVAASRLDDQLRSLAVEVWTAWRSPIRDVIQRGIDDGSFDPVIDTESAVTMILSLIDGGEVAVALQVEGAGAHTLVEELKATVGALLGVRVEVPHRSS